VHYHARDMAVVGRIAQIPIVLARHAVGGDPGQCAARPLAGHCICRSALAASIAGDRSDRPQARRPARRAFHRGRGWRKR